jgi:hypothetical protein
LPCLSGKDGFFTRDVVLDDGTNRRTIHLNRPYFGLYMPNMIWRELIGFSSGGICLVLASDIYREDDYFRNYDEFKEAARSAR